MQVPFFRPKVNTLVFWALICSCSILSFLFLNFLCVYSDEIYVGVNTAGISVGGKTIQEAESIVNKAVQDKLNSPIITIKYQEKSWEITAQDIELEFYPQQSVLQAYNVGRTGFLFQRLSERYQSMHKGVTVPLVISYNESKLISALNLIAKEIDVSPKDAVISCEDNHVIISSEIIGRQVNVSQLSKDIITDLQNTGCCQKELKVDEFKPDITQEELSHINKRLAVTYLELNQSDKERTKRIQSTIACLNAKLVHPNELFAFNKYINTDVYEDTENLCSSLLYATALKANLNIVERWAPPKPLGIIPLGFDTIVSPQNYDLKFINSLAHAIYITANIEDNKLAISIWGNNHDNVEVNIEANIVKVMNPQITVIPDPSLPLGYEEIIEEGKNGCQVVTERIISEGTHELKREIVSLDEYQPLNRIICIGSNSAIIK